MKNSALRVVLAAVTLLAFSYGVARATVLTFDIAETSSGIRVGDISDAPEDYGDRVAAFSTASGLSTYHYGRAESPSPKVEDGHGLRVTDIDLWDDNNGDFNQVTLPYNDSVDIPEVLMTADPIYELDIRSLDMRFWNLPVGPPVSSGW